MYINFIGPDGSGKDTIFDLIKENFKGALLTREPGGTKEAEEIRNVLLSTHMSDKERIESLVAVQKNNINSVTEELLTRAILAIESTGINEAEPFLYAASRSESIEKLIKPAVLSSRDVLGRRSVACSIAYQGNARNFGMENIWNLNEPIVRTCYPDLEIFFDLPIPVAMSRIAKRTEKQDRLDGENAEFYEKVREGYLHYYKNFCPYHFRIIDATKPIQEVYNDVLSIIEEYSLLNK